MPASTSSSWICARRTGEEKRSEKKEEKRGVKRCMTKGHSRAPREFFEKRRRVRGTQERAKNAHIERKDERGAPHETRVHRGVSRKREGREALIKHV